MKLKINKKNRNFWKNAEKIEQKVINWPEWKKKVQITKYPNKEESMNNNPDCFMIDEEGRYVFIDKHVCNNFIDRLEEYKQLAEATNHTDELIDMIQCCQDEFKDNLKPVDHMILNLDEQEKTFTKYLMIRAQTLEKTLSYIQMYRKLLQGKLDIIDKQLTDINELSE